MKLSKITVIGAGFVGEITASTLVKNEKVDEVVLLDIIEDMPAGKGLDMMEATPIMGSDTKVSGTNDYSKMEGSDIVVVTAGVPRKPGMDRMDLLKVNINICKSVVANIAKYAPDSMIIYVANPIDVLTYTAQKISGFPHHRVFGMAGILDTARYRSFIAAEANISVKDIRAMVLGGHGDSMVPLPRHTSVGGIPLSEFLSQEAIDRIVNRTRKGGGEIVSLLKTGSAYYAPGMAVAEMVEAVIRDQKRVLPVVAYLDNKYGMSDVYAGAPVILGKNGVEKILEIQLNDEELQAYQTSLRTVKKGIDEAQSLL
ncbi:MAG: malate dehydrogenase [Candidatus Heimdallarchaeota archaeon]|nr:malate dehydrogenase [Candidatus Heimdallarchaeota archaeon]